MKRIILAGAALLLSACAGTGTRDGMVYRDGSWYSPADAGRGDYYTGASHAHDTYYDWPWAWSVGFVPYGGYCPVMYRYCTSFWADPFYGPVGAPYAYQPWPIRRPHRPVRQREDVDWPVADGDDSPASPVRDPGARRGPRTGGGRVGGGATRREAGGPRRPRTGGDHGGPK